MGLELTDDNITDILKNNKITILQFSAEWCGPCRMLSPIIDDLTNSNKDIMIEKLNVDENSSAASKFGVRGIPTLIFFKDGEIVERVVGAKSKEFYQTIIDKLRGGE
jgi:thioredoxin 1